MPATDGPPAYCHCKAAWKLVESIHHGNTAPAALRIGCGAIARKSASTGQAAN